MLSPSSAGSGRTRTSLAAAFPPGTHHKPYSLLGQQEPSRLCWCLPGHPAPPSPAALLGSGCRRPNAPRRQRANPPATAHAGSAGLGAEPGRWLRAGASLSSPPRRQGRARRCLRRGRVVRRVPGQPAGRCAAAPGSGPARAVPAAAWPRLQPPCAPWCGPVARLPLWSAMAWLAGGLAELRWWALVALFVAALATLAVYLVQYALLALRRARPPPRPLPPAPQRDDLLEEGDTVLAWALSLGSWRRQWRRAWVAALNAEAATRTVSAGDAGEGRRADGRGKSRRPAAASGRSAPAGHGPGLPRLWASHGAMLERARAASAAVPAGALPARARCL